MRCANRAKLAAVVLTVCSVLLVSADASALAPTVEKLYSEAKVDVQAGRFYPALEKFKQALRLVKGHAKSEWQMMLGIAYTYEQMDQLDHSIEYYRRFLDRTSGRAATLDEKWTRKREVASQSIKDHEAVVLQVRGRVDINSQPPGGSVLVDGAAVGADGAATTPFVGYLAPGQRKVTVELPGYKVAKVTVRIEAGARQTVPLTLQKETKTGTVIVRTGSNDAVVWVNGKKQDSGAEVSLTLARGKHEIDVRKGDKSLFKQKIVVVEGKHRVLDVKQELASKDNRGGKGGPVVGIGGKVEPESKPIWPWIAVGGGVVAAGVGGAFTAMAAGKKSDIDALDTAALSPEEGDKEYDSLKSSLESSNTMSMVFYGVGTAGIIAGIVGFATSGGGDPEPEPAPAKPKDTPKPKKTSFSFGAFPTEGGAAVQAGWRF